MKASLFLLTFFVWTASLQAQTKAFHYVATLFQDNNPKVVAEGNLNAAIYKKWFASGYAVAGLRAEIPEKSVPVGALFIYSKGKSLTLPFYQTPFGSFQCQGHQLSEPPMFSAHGNTEAEFVADLKDSLASLH